MKTIIAFAFLLFSVMESFGQGEKPDFTLSVTFGPAFMAAAKMTVKTNKDSSLITFLYYKNFKLGTAAKIETDIINAGELAPLTEFLKTYKFAIKSSIDTLGVVTKIINGKPQKLYEVTVGGDGITVRGMLDQNGIEKKFQFWSPEKGTMNDQLAKILLGILNRSLKDQRLINYAELLGQCFDHDMGLKKLSANPLKYKLYGGLSSADSLQLHQFLDSIPKNQKVFIDMSNFSGMGTMYYPLFKAFSASHQNVYWINPSEDALKDLNGFGAPEGNIVRGENEGGEKNIEE